MTVDDEHYFRRCADVELSMARLILGDRYNSRERVVMDGHPPGRGPTFTSRSALRVNGAVGVAGLVGFYDKTVPGPPVA